MTILTNWVTKLVVVAAVLLVVGVDAAQVMIAHVGGKTDANNAAYAAAQNWPSSHNYTDVIAAARATLPPNVTLSNTGCRSSDGINWVCTVTRPAHTLFMNDIGPLKKYTVATESGTGSFSS